MNKCSCCEDEWDLKLKEEKRFWKEQREKQVEIFNERYQIDTHDDSVSWYLNQVIMHLYYKEIQVDLCYILNQNNYQCTIWKGNHFECGGIWESRRYTLNEVFEMIDRYIPMRTEKQTSLF